MQNMQNRKKSKSTFIGYSAIATALLMIPVAHAAPAAPTPDEIIKIQAVADEADSMIEPISLVEAIAYALDHSPQRQSAWSAAEAARAQIKTAKSAGGLQVGLTGSVSRQWGHGGAGGSGGSIGGIGGGISTGQSQGWRESLSIDANLPIYTGGRVKGNKKVAEYVFQTAIAQAISTEQDLIFNTTLGYLDILRTKQLVAVRQADLDVAKERLRVAQVRFDAGASPRLDVLRAATDEATATQNLVATQNSLNQARADLNTIMGRKPQTPLRVQPLRHLTLPSLLKRDGQNLQDEDEQDISDADEGVSLAEAVDMGNIADGTELFDVADQASPTLQALRAQFHSAEAAIDVAKAGRKPQIGISLSDAFSHPASFLGRFILSLGGSVVQNLFDSGKTSSEITAARATADQLRNSVYAGELSVANQIEQSLLSLNSALERETTTKAAVTSAQEALRTAQLGYSAGVQTTLDVSDAEAALLTAQTNEVNARFDVAASQAQLAAAVGVLTVEGERAYRPSEPDNELRPISDEKRDSDSKSARNKEKDKANSQKEQRQARRK